MPKQNASVLNESSNPSLALFLSNIPETLFSCVSTFYVCPVLPEEVHIHCEVVIVLVILCACFNIALFDIKSAAWYQKVLTAEMFH
jgi:hypothetical protein